MNLHDIFHTRPFAAPHFDLDNLRQLVALSPNKGEAQRPVHFPPMVHSLGGEPPVARVYAAHLCYATWQSAYRTGGGDSGLDVADMADTFEGYVEIFSSSMWRDHLPGTMEVLGYIDSESEHEILGEFLSADMFVERVSFPAYSLKVLHYPSGFVGLVSFYDEGYNGATVFNYVFD